MFYKECPICGASLDPGEKCDCTEKKETCTAATEQASKDKKHVNTILLNNSTTEEICQVGGGLSD